MPITSYWRASEYVLRPDPKSVDEDSGGIWEQRIEAHSDAIWERHEPFGGYEARGRHDGPHSECLNLLERRTAAGMVDFANKHGLLGAFSRYYRDRPVLPAGKFFVAPEAVFVQGRLVTIDPKTEGMALIGPGGKLDELLDGEQATRERIIALLKYGPFVWTRVPEEQVAMPSEVSFVRTAADAPTPVPDRPYKAIPWGRAREGFEGLLVLDPQSPTMVSVLCRSETVGMWLYLLGMFQLACFPEPGGDAEDEMIQEINLEIAGASPYLTRSEDGRYERNWRCQDLLQSLYLMLFLDATADREIRKCQAPGCPYYFRVGKHDKARKYCPHPEPGKASRCGSRATSRRNRDRQRQGL